MIDKENKNQPLPDFSNKTNNYIALMTSGGDAPGMNMTIISLLRFFYLNQWNVKVIYDGIAGLVKDEIQPFDYIEFQADTDHIFDSGTFIRSSRYPEFKLPENICKAVNNLKKANIKLLIILGGDGSYHAAQILMHNGINVIGIPATIDNDVGSTDYTIGFNSALNLILQEVIAIRHTVKSFNSFCLIEVMGRECSDLSVCAALASFADAVITRFNPWTKEDFVNQIKLIKSHHKNWGIFIVTEKFYGTGDYPSYNEIVNYVESQLKLHMRFNSIGYAQRGANPTASELVSCFKFAQYCVQCIENNIYNVALGIQKDELVHFDFDVAIKMQKPNNLDEIKLIDLFRQLNYQKD